MSGFADRENKRKSGGVVASMLSKEAQRGELAETAKETKKRYNLVILPSVYEDVQKIAYIERRSVSEIVGELLEGYAKANADKLAEYDDAKK